VVQQHAAVVVAHQAELPFAAGAEAERPGQGRRVAVAGGLPGHRHVGGPPGLPQRREHRCQRRHRPHDQQGVGLGGRGDLGTHRRLTRRETAQVELDEGHADTLPPASRSIAGDESRGSTARCRQSC
jgi:hypothetical protein